MKNDFKEKIKKLTEVKGFGLIFIGICAGLILLLIPDSSKSNESVSNPKTDSGLDYCVFLEEKAESLIKELPEVEDCAVFITLESGYQYIYATDQHVKESENAKETDKTIVLAGNGSGEAPILVKETMPKIAGVAIVCGGASYETQYRIVELMCALFDIESHRISVQA